MSMLSQSKPNMLTQDNPEIAIANIMQYMINNPIMDNIYMELKSFADYFRSQQAYTMAYSINEISGKCISGYYSNPNHNHELKADMQNVIKHIKIQDYKQNVNNSQNYEIHNNQYKKPVVKRYFECEFSH